MAMIETSDVSKALTAGPVGRRKLLQALASVGVVATLFPVMSRRAAAAVNLSYYTWSGYDLPEFHQSFVDKYGASPEYSIFGEEEEGLQKLRSGFTADVAHPCTSNVRRWRDAGVLKPIDASRLEQWENVFPSFKEIRGVHIDGEMFHMPWDWGNTSVLYRTDKVEITEESYDIFLDERYKGQMSMFDSGETVPVIAALIAGIQDPWNMNDDELAQSLEIMKKMNANMRFYWTDSTQIEQAMASGELVAATTWNESVLKLQNQGIPVAYMTPKEGILTWVCGLSLLSGGTGDEDQKYDFLNAMLSIESGKQLIEQYNYGHSNRKAMDQVDPALLKQLGIDNAEERLKTTRFFDEIPPATRERMNAMLEQVKAGL